MENGVSPVSCPVCTLYMREGVTLKKHLETHPKDQVIAALVRISAGDSPGTTENQSDNQTSVAGSGNQELISGSQCYPPSSSHFTTAITYQHFLSSNGCATNNVIPQYVSFPAILSAPGADHSASNQAAFMQMVYSPFLVQQQQQQQFQLLSSVTSPSFQQPFMRPVVPSYSTHHVPQPQISVTSVPVPQTVPYQASDFPTGHVPQELQNANNIIPSSVSLPHSSSSSLCTSSLPCSVSSGSFLLSSVREQSTSHNEPDTVNRPRSVSLDQHRTFSVSKEIVQCSKQQVIEEPVIPDVPKEDADIPSSTGSTGTVHSGVATQTNDICCENDDQKSPCVVKDVQGAVSLEDAASSLQQEPLRGESVNVRVRKDLNDVAVSPMVHSHDSGSEESVEDEYMDMRNDDVSQMSGVLRSTLRIQPPPISVADSDEYITSDRQFSSQGEPSTEESAVKEISDLCQENCEKLDEKKEGSSNRFLDLDSSEPVSVIEIDGIRILVPSHFLENPPSLLGAKVSAEDSPASLPLGLSLSHEDKIRHPRETEPQATPVPNLNIQTDDDLLAREQWELSDGSDADIILEHEATASVIEKQDKSVTSREERRRDRETRVYKCGTCGEPFNCPKERRVHRTNVHCDDKSGCSKMLASASGVKVSASVESRKQVYKRKPRLKRMIKEEDDKCCVKTEEPQFMEVFLEEDTETKMEIEDGEQLPENVSASVDTVETGEVLKHEPELESTAVHPCSMCTEVFTTPKLRTSHEHKVHKKSKEKKNVCATCKEVFTSDAEYQSHLKTHPLECLQCGKYFYRRQNLELHLKRHLGIKPHKCTICDKAFVTKQKLAEHTNSHTGNAPIKCPLCDETFRRYSNLIQHKNRHHMKIKKKVRDFICHCGEIFHSKKKLEWHKEIHEEKPKCCTYCSERFVHASSLTRHIRKAHDCRYVPKCGREVENVECKLCGYVFLKSSLPVHMRMHSGERPYSCHVCGKDFTTKWNLQLHRWTHAARSSKPFKCSLCKSAFFRRNDYTAHMHSHRNVRPYTCNHCGCQFIRKYNCLRHVREHEVGKSFSCNVCGKLFHRSYYLKEHLRVHSGARPFACHICGKASSTKSNHNKHVKIHHAREPVNTEG